MFYSWALNSCVYLSSLYDENNGNLYTIQETLMVVSFHSALLSQDIRDEEDW